jgi:4-amino-4-deoxy-L-arabinose transferase-like glycosyltransferase
VNDGWRKELLLIIALSIPFIFWGIGSIDLLDPDEGMYGAITREMAEGGDWITPHFNGVRYLEKPPLYFWLTALTTAIFGPSEWVVRLWTAIPALGTALLTWRLGELLYGGHVGLLSAIVMLSGVGAFRYVRVPATDFLLVFSITLSIYGFVRSILLSPAGNNQRAIDPDRGSMVDQKSLVLFYLGAGLAVLSKGLVGLFFPLLIVGLFLLLFISNGQLLIVHRPWDKIGRFISTLWSPMGILLVFIINLPWLVLASWKNPGFFDFYIVDVQFLRFFNSRAFIEDDIPLTTLAFLIMIFIWVFPWSPFLPAALRQGFPGLTLTSRNKESLRLLVGSWAVAVIGFFFTFFF